MKWLQHHRRHDFIVGINGGKPYGGDDLVPGTLGNRLEPTKFEFFNHLVLFSWSVAL
jgi:hypothetical protein